MNLLKYVISANSFILLQVPDNLFSRIKNIILFGSVARGDFTKASDVDIFYDVKMSRREVSKLKKIINIAIEKFYVSDQGLLFRAKGISNKISAVVGDLERWGLKDEIVKYGVSLYSKYISKLEGEPYILIWWESLSIKNRGAFLNKLYGYTIRNKHYKGVIDKLDGIKIGKSAFAIPIKHKDRVLELLKKYNVSFNQIIISTSL